MLKAWLWEIMPMPSNPSITMRSPSGHYMKSAEPSAHRILRRESGHYRPARLFSRWATHYAHATPSHVMSADATITLLDSHIFAIFSYWKAICRLLMKRLVNSVLLISINIVPCNARRKHAIAHRRRIYRAATITSGIRNRDGDMKWDVIEAVMSRARSFHASPPLLSPGLMRLSMMSSSIDGQPYAGARSMRPVMLYQH